MVVLGLKSSDLGSSLRLQSIRGEALSLALSKQPDLNPQQIAKRSAFVVNDVQGADFFRIKTSRRSRLCKLPNRAAVFSRWSM